MAKPLELSLLSILIAAFLVGFWSCKENELGVYTLCSYEDNWKSKVCVDSAYDPYENFWTIMNCGSDPPYADPDESRRYKNEEVNIRSILPIPGDSYKGWDQFDLVFFYGHNNMIVPPHPHEKFGYYTYNGASWDYHYEYLDLIGWGSLVPYDYYTYPGITTGNTYPGSVTYLYYKYTSALLGGVYHYGQDTGYDWRMRWNDPVQTTIYEPLGNMDLEFLILHGCQAVITANQNGSYNDMGLRCFHWTQGSWHIILGHYKSFGTSQLVSLVGFAYDLIAGVPVQEAYFDVDPANNSSAIAAEADPFPGWANSTMVNDKWCQAGPDYEDTNIFSMRWITNVGTTQQAWN